MSAQLTQVPCPNCDGTGMQLGPYDSEVRCKLCHGLGHVSHWEPDEGVR